MHHATIRLALGLAMPALVLAGCADLSSYPTDACGNSVVDEARGEQCDSHVADGQSCGAPGGIAQCRYVCSVVDPARGGDRYACPQSFSCGIDDVCHRSSGKFRLAATDNNFSLGSRLGDFDGSRTADVLTSGLSRLDVSSYDDDGILSSRQSLGGGVQVPPEVGELDAAEADGRSFDDVVYTKSGNVVVALGSSQGLTPKSYAGIRLDVKPPVFFFSVPRALARLVDLDASLVLADGPDYELKLLAGDQVLPIMAWPYPGKLPTSAVTANFDPSSGCNEVILAYDSFLASWTPCPNGESFAYGDGEDAGGDPVDPVTLRLEDIGGGKRRLAGPPALVNLDRDGALDLVVEVNECADSEPDACAFFQDEPSPCCHLYIAWGMTALLPPPEDPDGAPVAVATGRFASGPANGGEPDTLGRLAEVVEFPISAEQSVSVHPIGWGDVNGDGVGDLVTQNAAFVGDPSTALSFALAALNQGLPWRDAVIADFDGDGFDDIVASPFLTPALTYLRGNAGSTMTYATIQVERPYSKVLGGDLDGDGHRDILGLTRSTDGTRDELAVHYFADGSFAAPRAIGSFPVELGAIDDPTDDQSSILQLGIGKVPPSADALDSIDDVVAMTTYAGAAQDARVGIAVFEGSADRQLTAPIVISPDDATTVSVGYATFGHFESGLPSIVAESFIVDLDADLEILGRARAIDVLQGEALATAFPVGIDIKPTTLLGAGNWDDDADDELVFVVPACDAQECPEGTEAAGSREACCATGSEQTRFFLLDKVNRDLRLATVAPVPLGFAGEASRLYIGDRGFRVGRLQLVDLNADGISEALLLVNESLDGISHTRAVLVHRRGEGLAVTEVPSMLTVGDAPVDLNVYGFAALRDVSGKPLVAIGAREGLFAVAVTLGEDEDGPTFTFDEPAYVLDARGAPLLEEEVTSVEAGDVNGDGIDDLVLTRPFSTELYLGSESFEPPEGTP